MQFDNVMRIIKADPDSQFRLLPCAECGSDNVAYVEYKKGAQEPWRVQCFDCGHMVDKQSVCRHQAQMHWNKEARHEKS